MGVHAQQQHSENMALPLKQCSQTLPPRSPPEHLFNCVCHLGLRPHLLRSCLTRNRPQFSLCAAASLSLHMQVIRPCINYQSLTVTLRTAVLRRRNGSHCRFAAAGQKPSLAEPRRPWVPHHRAANLPKACQAAFKGVQGAHNIIRQRFSLILNSLLIVAKQTWLGRVLKLHPAVVTYEWRFGKFTLMTHEWKFGLCHLVLN